MSPYCLSRGHCRPQFEHPLGSGLVSYPLLVPCTIYRCLEQSQGLEGKSVWSLPLYVQCKTVYDGCDHLQYSVITAVINNKSPFPPPRSPYLWPVWAGGTKKEHYGFKISCLNTGKWGRVQLEIDQLSKLNRSDERLSSLSIRGKLRAKVPANWWELVIFAEGINYKEMSTCMHFIVDVNEWIIIWGK